MSLFTIISAVDKVLALVTRATDAVARMLRIKKATKEVEDAKKDDATLRKNVQGGNIDDLNKPYGF